MVARPFPFPKSSTPGARPNEGEGRYMNCYPITEGQRSYVRRLPGLERVASTGQSGIRGMIDVSGIVYVVWAGSVTAVIGSGVVTLSGSIPGTDGVTLTRNNKVTSGVSDPDIVAVREGGGAYIITVTAVSAYPDADLPTTANSVDFLGGYFLFTIPDGRIFASELNSTDINALSFTTAENRSDGLRRIVVQGNLAYAMGGSTIEPYQNVGTSPFPLQRAATVLPSGALTTMGVAGFEEGWSQALYFVASDNTTRALSGYTDTIVSTPDVDRFVSASTTSTLRLMCYTYNGRPFLAMSSDAGTWELDVSSGAWHERTSVGTSPARWRASCSVYSNDRWLFGDVLTGDILRLSTALLENGSAFGGFIQSGQLQDFPARIATAMAANFTAADMTIYVSWSRDGGTTYSTEIPRSIAHAEKYATRVASLGLSTSIGFIIRLRWEGAVDFSFSGATAESIKARAA